MIIYFQTIQGEVRSRELEVDSVTERAQQLHKGSLGGRSSHIGELGIKYQQISLKVKELVTRWHQCVLDHEELDNVCSECANWLDNISQKLSYCSDLSASSQDDLETKLATIQDLLLYREEGFSRVESTLELAHKVSAWTAANGHEPINNRITLLQDQWSALAAKMIETKVIYLFVF